MSEWNMDNWDSSKPIGTTGKVDKPFDLDKLQIDLMCVEPCNKIDLIICTTRVLNDMKNQISERGQVWSRENNIPDRLLGIPLHPYATYIEACEEAVKQKKLKKNVSLLEDSICETYDEGTKIISLYNHIIWETM